ncbi:MAG: hypothetical protein ACKOX6_17005 [Bdellovibrio sp.]
MIEYRDFGVIEMLKGFQSSLMRTVAGAILAASIPGLVFAQDANSTSNQTPPKTGTPAANTLPGNTGPALTPQQVADYIANPGRMLTDLANDPAALSRAVAQLSTSGITGSKAGTDALKAAVSGGNKDLAATVARGLGLAVARLTQSGNINLATSIQGTVAQVATDIATSNKPIADAINVAFAEGQSAVATAALGQTAGSNALGSGSPVDGSAGRVLGAANGFRAPGDSSSGNSSNSTFGGTGSSTVTDGGTTNVFNTTTGSTVPVSPS